LLRIFQASIAPQTGNIDAIHGALVNLLLIRMRCIAKERPRILSHLM
jgi:hypothetical protein